MAAEQGNPRLAQGVRNIATMEEEINMVLSRLFVHTYARVAIKLWWESKLRDGDSEASYHIGTWRLEAYNNDLHGRPLGLIAPYGSWVLSLGDIRVVDTAVNPILISLPLHQIQDVWENLEDIEEGMYRLFPEIGAQIRPFLRAASVKI